MDLFSLLRVPYFPHQSDFLFLIFLNSSSFPSVLSELNSDPHHHFLEPLK